VNLYSLLVYIECMFNKWGVSVIRWDVFITQVKLRNDYSNLLTKEKHFCCSNLTAVGHKNRQKENWVTEDSMGRRSQESNTRTVVKNLWSKTSGNGVHSHNIHKSGISRHRSPGDKIVELSLFLPEGHCPHGNN
jgi:hypothetical protein